MDPDNSAKQFDEDILKCRQDILRRKGIVPPFGRPPKQPLTASADVPKIPEMTTENSIPTAIPIKEDAAQEPDAVKEEKSTFKETDKLYSQLQQFAPDSNKLELRANVMAENKSEENHSEDNEIKDKAIQAAEPDLNDEQFMAETGPIPEITDADIDTEKISNEVPPEPEVDEIPSFDLAEQIMAEHRKLAQNRRKKPGSQHIPIMMEQKPKLNISPAKRIEPPMSPQQKVIAEIVARDINKFYSSYAHLPA